MKFVVLIAVVVIGYMVITGDMGGAKDATNNYGSVMRGQ
jgi:type IV secretory pathway VirB2 component (pilin)